MYRKSFTQVLALMGVCLMVLQYLRASDLTQIQNCVNNEFTAISGDDIFAVLLKKSRIEKKNIFLLFSFQACGMCRIFEKYHNDSIVNKILDKYIIIKMIDINKTPGGSELYKTYGKVGFPSWTIIDSTKKVIIDNGNLDGNSGNTGYPRTERDIEYYIKSIKKAAPSIKPLECEVLSKKLNEYRPKNDVSSQDNNWTHFRGSNMNGIAMTDSIPLKWDCSNIKWKTEIHGRGFSSPVVYNDQVWVTTAMEDGSELYAVCTDFRTGKIVHDIKVFSPQNIFGKNAINTYASPTPCIEKGLLFVNYGSLGTACIKTTDGTIVWTRTDLKCNHILGAGSSPILYKNLLILHFEGTDARFIIALDKLTGKTVWKTNRPVKPYEKISEIGRKAYTTPIIVNVKGRDLIISNGSAVCCAYEPLTGYEVWRIVRGEESTASMPFTEDGVVYYYTGFMVDQEKHVFTEILAANPDASGDITGSNVLWKKRDNQTLTQVLTPVIKDGLIYTINTKNILMCIDAKTGTEIWSVHLKANFNASPVYVNGNIWFFSVRGDIMVLKAGRKYKMVAQNKTDSGIWATPAFLRNSVVLRSERFLYRIGW